MDAIQSAISRRDYAGALQLCDEMIYICGFNGEPSPHHPHAATAAALFVNKGIACDNALSDAIAAYETALQWLPGAVHVYHHWGLTLLRLGKLYDATEKFTAALAVDSHYLPSVRGCVESYASRIYFNEAITVADRYLEHNAPDPALLTQKAFACLRVGRVAESVAAFAVAIDSAYVKALPSGDVKDVEAAYVAALTQLGESADASGDSDTALSCFARVIALAPTPQRRFNYALMLAKKGDADAALPELRAVLATEPNNIPALVACGTILLQSGMTDECITALSHADQLLTDHSEVWLCLLLHGVSQLFLWAITP